jgi:hypothetical protein
VSLREDSFEENCRLTAYDFGDARARIKELILKTRAEGAFLGLALPRVAKRLVAVPALNNPSNRAILAV